MKDPNRERKNEIKYNVTLNDEQKEAKRLIVENQIVIITGRAGSGKSLVGAQTALDFLNKKMCDKVLVTRAMIELEDDSMGFLPGSKNEKFAPYMEAFRENLEKCIDKVKVQDLITAERIIAGPINFIRGKTIDDVLIVEEAQNLTRFQMLSILTRLGKTGKMIINGDNDQQDINLKHESQNGLQFAIELSKNIKDIKRINLKENHRSDLVGKILDFVYNK